MVNETEVFRPEAPLIAVLVFRLLLMDAEIFSEVYVSLFTGNNISIDFDFSHCTVKFFLQFDVCMCNKSNSRHPTPAPLVWGGVVKSKYGFVAL